MAFGLLIGDKVFDNQAIGMSMGMCVGLMIGSFIQKK